MSGVSLVKTFPDIGFHKISGSKWNYKGCGENSFVGIQ